MSNNKILLNGCIQQYKNENELLVSDSEVFELFSLTQITKTYDLQFDSLLNSIVDGGQDGGIDSIITIVDDHIPETVEDLEEIKLTRKSAVFIIISQCKKENSFKESALDKLITTIPELFNLEKTEDALLVRFNPSVVEKGMIAREVWKKCSISGGQLNIVVNYCANSETIEINNVFQDKVEQLKALIRSHFIGASISYDNYSSEELLRLYQKQRNERLHLIFKEAPLSTRYKDFGIGYVGTVKLADLKQFLTDEDNGIRDGLFESNIRHYQGLVDVNKKVKETIERVGNEDFWWLNNGITVIANNPSLVGTTLSLDNVQIVNGLQTSYSIFLNHSGDSEDVRSVLVKVLINEDKQTIDHIIASTNSQNPVSPALLRATDDVQREIEIFFLTAGYFYDRRKNYYKNQGKPAGRIFGIQVTAQAVETIIFSNPHSARSKPTSLLKEDVTYHRIFNQNANYNIYLICSLLCKKTIEFWGALEDKEGKNKLSNFKLHLARIAASILSGKDMVSHEDIIEIDLSQYDVLKFSECCQLLLSCIDNYQQSNDNANLINMAKAKGLTDQIIQRLKDIYTT